MTGADWNVESGARKAWLAELVGQGRYGNSLYGRKVVVHRYWVVVASLEHARRGIEGGFVMANHGKRGALARVSHGDGILIYSPKTTYPDGEPIRAITVVGEVIGDQPEPSDVIPGGFRRGAELREIEPLPLAEVRQRLPVSRIRFGFFELNPADAEAILAMVHSKGG